jgi:hypothetical protein
MDKSHHSSLTWQIVRQRLNTGYRTPCFELMDWWKVFTTELITSLYFGFVAE